jgi:hypothetical protein
MFLEEGAIEGVRGDIAFCQSCKETGFFSFKGQSLPEWNNYCGLGVTGNIGTDGIPLGNKFADARTGIRAQIQHLKAYACNDNLKNAVVDTRFKYVVRDTAPYWVSLNGKWAVPGNNYGQDILGMFNDLMKFAKDDPNIPDIKPTPVENPEPVLEEEQSTNTNPSVEKINVSLVNKVLELMLEFFKKLLKK